jgi:hypothetical protein
LFQLTGKTKERRFITVVSNELDTNGQPGIIPVQWH